MPTTHTPCGRPEPGEYAAYAQQDVAMVAGDDIVAALDTQLDQVMTVLEPLDESAVAGLTYAPGKWTLKEVVGHLIDDERIFAYRALRIGRNDPTPLPGFDEKPYVQFADFEERTLADLLAEYRLVRAASLALFRSFSQAAWLRRGEVNHYPASARGLAFHLAGHELHHLRVLEERYLPRL